MAIAKLVIQAGHVNNEYSQPLNLGSGAPNEKSFNLDIANKVSEELRKRGFEVVQTDANAFKDPVVTENDYDMFLAIHYDADIYGTGGGFVDFCDPAFDKVTDKSQAIAQAIRDEYFKTTGIVNHPERSNKNTRRYYMWRYLTEPTPCVLIECGVGMHVEDDWKTLHFNRPVVVEGLVRGICKAFSVSYEVAQPQPQQPTECEKLKAENEALKLQILEAEKTATATKQALEANLAAVKEECQKKVNAYKNVLADIKNLSETSL